MAQQPNVPTPTDAPWWLRVLREHGVIANVVAYGAALALLYTAVFHWPRLADRFADEMRLAREEARETQHLLLENQKLLIRLESTQRDNQRINAAQNKVLEQMWHEMKADRKKQGPPEPDEP